MHTCTGTVFKIQREYTLADIRRYLSDIRHNGMEIVVIWPAIFWWEDREKPGYPYNTGREILVYAQEIGLKVIMETAGQIPSLEYAPDFVMKREYLPITVEGQVRDDGGSYGFLNYFHPEVAALVERQLTGICEAYRTYPALYGYDIFNETMFESYDDFTLQRFRDWLRHKYGTIGRLNAVWDRAYYDWSQVRFTRWVWASVMPVVDLIEFQKDCIGIQLAEWRAIVHRVDPDHPALADNLYSMFCGTPNDNEWVTDENVDELGMSYYPKNSVPALPPHRRWQMLRGFHSVTRGRRFWVAEMQTHTQSAYRPGTSVSVRELRTWSWECYAGGCKGVIYWKWLPFSKGLQTTGRGLTDYRGQPTPRSEETQEIARVLRENAALFDATLPEQPRGAILYDRTNLAFQRAYTQFYSAVPQNQYHDAVEGLSQCLFDASVPANFVRPDAVGESLAAQYPVLFVTAQLLMTDALSDGLRAYAAAGGTVVIDGKFGFVSADGVLLDAIPGGRALQALLGFDWYDVDAEGQHITGTWDSIPLELNGYYERQLLRRLDEQDETQVLAAFDDGYPALIRRVVGNGCLLYLPTALWYGYRKEGCAEILAFMNLLADRLDMRTYRLTPGPIRAFVSQGEPGELIYAFNYADQPGMARFDRPACAGDYILRELRTNRARLVSVGENGLLSFDMAIDANDVAIYAVERKSCL